MLKQGTLVEVNSGLISKASGYLVLTTRFYPRFLKREKIDDYLIDLAPSKKLFTDFKNSEMKLHDHNLAFEKVDYENRFELNEKGFSDLKNLSLFSQTQDVFLLCYCDRDQCCHRELLLLIAENKFGAKIEDLSREYSIFRRRLVEC